VVWKEHVPAVHPNHASCGFSLPSFPRRAFLANYRDGFSLFFFFLVAALTAGSNSSLGRFCPAMVVMLQRLDARSFFVPFVADCLWLFGLLP
jgi:hypothetical protein